MSYTKSDLEVVWYNPGIIGEVNVAGDDDIPVCVTPYTRLDGNHDTEKYLNERIDELALNVMTLKDMDKNDKLWSDCDFEERSVIVWIGVYGDKDYRVVNESDGADAFLKLYNEFETGKLIDLIEVEIDDNLL